MLWCEVKHGCSDRKSCRTDKIFCRCDRKAYVLGVDVCEVCRVVGRMLRAGGQGSAAIAPVRRCPFRRSVSGPHPHWSCVAVCGYDEVAWSTFGKFCLLLPPITKELWHHYLK